MPDPHDTLAIFAEVSIALAGFSGIAIAFGQRSLGSLTVNERRRLSNLFVLSGSVLLLSLLGISLLHMEIPDPRLLWRGGSAVVFMLTTPWLAWDMVRVRRLDASEKVDVNRYFLYSFNSLAVAALILQLANVTVIMQAWPFLLALTLAITGAFQQFVLLIRAGLSDA